MLRGDASHSTQLSKSNVITKIYINKKCYHYTGRPGASDYWAIRVLAFEPMTPCETLLIIPPKYCLAS